MFKRIIPWVLLIVVDGIVGGILTVVLDLNSVTGFIAILGVVAFSLIVSEVVKLYYRKLLIYFNLNIIIAPLIFYMVVCLWLRYTIRLKMAEKSFSAGQETYQLIIHKQSDTFAIAKVKDKDFTYFQGLIEGEVFMKNDTTFLRNIKKHIPDDKNELDIYIYKDTLFNYPQLKNRVILQDRL